MPAGSIGKRPGPRGDSWYYRIDLGHDASGKRLQKTKRGYPSEATAIAAMQDELVKRRGGTFVESSKEPLAAYLECWLIAGALQWRSSTRRRKRFDVQRLIPHIGSVPLGKLTAMQIQSAYSAMLESLAPSTVRLSHATLTQALEQAVRWRVLAFNPAKDVDLPRLPPDAFDRWSADETRRFLDASAGDPLHALWRLLLDTGMRIGEAQALRWHDIDMDGMMVSIERTVTRTEDHREIVGHYPKTASSRRVVPIVGATVDALKRLRNDQRIRRVALGPLWQDDDLVFDAGDGRLYWQKTLGRRLDVAIMQAGVPRLTPHGLRHTNATLLSQAGVPAKVIAERLGHNKVNITLDRYVHPDSAAHRQAADALARLLETPA